MINVNIAKAYCYEDISLIENYEQAINDKTQTWDCHHKLEIELGVSQYELKKRKLFWKRPASELIFLTRSEHMSLHSSHKTKEHQTRINAAMKNKRSGKNSARAKAVYQIHKATGIIIREWKCMNEAARILGIPQSSIVLCCQGKYKSAGRFIWRYVDDYNSKLNE